VVVFFFFVCVCLWVFFPFVVSSWPFVYPIVRKSKDLEKAFIPPDSPRFGFLPLLCAFRSYWSSFYRKILDECAFVLNPFFPPPIECLKDYFRFGHDPSASSFLFLPSEFPPDVLFM